MFLSIIAGAIALRSLWIAVFTWKMYCTTSTRKPAVFMASLIISSADVLIIYVCVRYIIQGGF